MSDIAVQDDTELALIKRETARLVSSGAFAAEEDLGNLYKTSRDLLSHHLQPGMPASEDPELALKVFSTLHKANIELMETKRRVLDTAIKARTMFTERPPEPVASNDVPEDEGDGDTSSGPFAGI